MRVSTVATTVLAALASAVAEDGCPSGQVYGESFGKCYFFLKQSGTFEAAEELCGYYFGSLVSIQSAFEKGFLAGQAEEQFGEEDYWIGLTDPLNDGNWQWPDGSKATYTNWATGFPVKSNVVSLSCVASLAGSGKWYNTLCDDKQPNFVCQTGLSSNCTGKVINGPCNRIACPPGTGCDTVSHFCCPTADAVGPCVNVDGVGSCSAGNVCYPTDAHGGIVSDSMCYPECNGVGKAVGPAISGTCPQGYTNVLGCCCDSY